MTDSFVESGGVRIATRDHGGSGSPVLLVPGAGRTLEDFTPLAPLLAAEHRVVSLDVRCHGLSDVAPFVLEHVLDDVLAVGAHYGFERPAVVGHSMGGMFAALLGTRPGVLSAAVNVDGHGSGRPGQFLGISDDRAAELKASMVALQDSAQRPILTPDAVAVMKPALIAQFESRGLSAAFAEAVIARTVAELPDGTFETRPHAVSAKELGATLESLELLATYRATTVPLLVYNCTSPQLPPGLPDWVPELMKALRDGLRRDLTALAVEHPLVSTIEVPDSGHDVHLDNTELLAEQVNDFLARGC